MPVTNWNKALENISSFQDIIAMLKNLFGEVENKADSSVIDTIQTTVDSIKQGYKLFDTLALLNAYTGTDKAEFEAKVNFDSVAANNGTYLWKNAAWTKSIYDPTLQAKTYADQNLAKIATTTTTKNLYNPADKVVGYYVSTAGGVLAAAGWAMVYIAVTPGQQITVSANAAKRTGSAFYDANKVFLAGTYVSDVVSATQSQTFTVPSGAAFFGTNVYSSTIAEPTQLQVEVGSAATAYTPYVASSIILKDEALPSTVARKSDVAALTAKPYESIVNGKNLFDPSKVKDGQYLNSTNGGIVAAAGWGTSGEIAVTPGQQITISGTRGRAGVACFADSTTITAIAGSYNGSTTNPLTITVPAGATYLRINLYSSTATTYSNVQVEVGSAATAYEAYIGNKTLLKASDIYPPINTSATFADATLAITSNSTASITAKLSAANTLRMDLITSKTVTHDQANRFNFDADYINGTQVRLLGDDIAPYRVFGTTIGANHGYSKTTITLVGHGKTNADVGSVWSDGTKQWVIVDIVSTSQLNITARADNTAFSSGTLTHVSGASNTASMTPTAALASQWYPVSKNRSLSCNVDGVSVDLATVASYSYKSHATFSESYDIMSKTDIVEWIILNKGAALLYYYADASLSVSMSYRFDTRGGCTISTDFAALKAISAFQDIMFTQSVKMNTTGGAVNFYIPKTLPFVHESVNYDFSAPTSLDSTTLATRINFTSDRCVATGQLPDRVIQLNNSIGYATGYLPVLDTAPGVRRTNASNKALQISEAKKTYMSCIDGLKTSLSAGDYFRTVCYRNYFELSSARTATYIVESGQGDYLYADYHAAHANTLDRIVLPPKFHGKTVSVDEKSSNVSLLSGGTSAIVTSSVALKVGAYQSSTYAVLQIK